MDLLIEDLMQELVKAGGSDLHLSAGNPPYGRFSGQLRPIVQDTKLSEESCNRLIFSLLNNAQRKNLEQNWELDCSYGLKGVARFRVNVYRQRGTYAACLRALGNSIPSLEKLGLPPIVEEISSKPKGLVLVTGPTGSGKTTTLASLIEHINATRSEHILTIEDPVEFVHPHKQCIINQREVGVDTKSYAAALKSSLREAPDIILIGEIRSRETMEAAIELAGTGHLAISTLHANNAHQALERVINLFPQALHKTLFLDLSINMRAIISQRLVKTVSGKRTAAIEVLVNTPHIADLIRDGRVDEVSEAMQASNEDGMKTFDDALLDLFRAGTISFNEALANADSAPNLEARINFG